MLPTLVLYATLLVCAAGIGWIAWRYDMYDKEPPAAIACTIAFGAALMWLSGRVQSFLIDLTVDHAVSLAGNTLWSINAGITEEIAKLAAVFITLRLFRKHFNDPMDGLIYGAFAGLGAAIEESVFHMGLSGTTGLLPGQEPVRLAGHLVMGGIGGFGLGTLALRHPRWWAWTLLTLAGAATLHTLWDLVAFSAAEHATGGGKPRALHVVGGIALMLAGMVAFRALVSAGQRLAKSYCHVSLTP